MSTLDNSHVPGVHDALLAFQAEAPALQKTKINPAFGGKSKYVPLEDLIAEITPVLTTHGLVWVTMPGELGGEPVLRYSLTHAASRESIDGTMLLRSKGTPQDQGSAITYARRYSMMAVLNLAGNEDDDGQRASRPPRRPAARKTPKATLEALATAAKGLTGAKIKMAFASAGVAYPNEGGMFDSIASADAEPLIVALEGMPR
jgi:ERF superfamily